MQPFNVEIFDRNFNFIHNYTIESPVYKYDYLTPTENDVTISFNKNIAMGQYIVIANAYRKYEGVISGIEVISKDFIKVKYKPLTNLFNTTVYIDYRNQDPAYSGHAPADKSIEQIIYENIVNIYINGYPPMPWELSSMLDYPTDNLQKIPNLVVTKKTDTMVWQLGLEMSSGWGQYQYFCEVNLSNFVIPRALKQAGVLVTMRLDIQNKKVYCDIEKTSTTSLVIEADLPQIIKKTINEISTIEMPNKVIVLPYPPDGSIPVTVYYRHSDGTWDTNDTDRLTPVILYSESVSASEYPNMEAELFDKYGAVLYANLIELTTLYGVYNIEIGNVVSIISGDKQYESMFTGYEIKNNTIKLIFGMLRLDLTKILKGRSM